MGSTKIEWATKSWNPVTGCSPISEGCAHCYAARMANRLRGRCGYPKDEPFQVTIHEDRLEDPMRWKKPQRIFVGSMTDLFLKEPNFDSVRDHYGRFIPPIFDVIDQCPHHTFMFLTKRPSHMAQVLCGEWSCDAYGDSWHFREGKPMANVWIGVTCENQARADERIPILLQIPAAKRFVSLEPMLGEVDLREYVWERPIRPSVGLMEERLVYRPSLDWVILGGETGPGARPMHPDWVRSVRDQCQAAGVPFFFKQWGEWVPFGQALSDGTRLNHTSAIDVKMGHHRIELDGLSSVAPKYNAYGRIWSKPFPVGSYGLRVGKKAAGHLLDGREWRELPGAGKE